MKIHSTVLITYGLINIFFVIPTSSIPYHRQVASRMAASSTSSATRKASTLLQHNFQCRCGKVQLSVNTPNPLRLVCYCKDCRGYYNTLHHHVHEPSASKEEGHADKSKKDDTTSTSPWLDSWGGCDYIHVIQPSEVKIVKGQEHMKVCKIRPNSMIRRVYADCCDTPLFSSGGTQTLLVNSLLISNENDRPPVTYRIMGRQALSKPLSLSEEKLQRPSISWSVPFSWFWTMAHRMPDKKEPLTFPIELPNDIPVLDGFQQG